jgi:hypothetical protein
MFALLRDEVMGGCIKLLMREFMICTLPNISLLISRKVKLTGLAACMWVIRLWFDGLKVLDCLGGQYMYVKIILKWL